MRSVAYAPPAAPRPTRCAVCRVGYSLPFITPPRPTDCRSAPSRGIRQPAGKYVLANPWGAPRLRAAALSSLPACAPFPQRRAISHAFPLHPPPALGRVAAASYSGAALGARCARARWHLRRLPSPRGSCSLRSHSPRHASRRAPNLWTVERRGWSRSPRGIAVRVLPKAATDTPQAACRKKRGRAPLFYIVCIGEVCPLWPATYCVK